MKDVRERGKLFKKKWYTGGAGIKKMKRNT